MLGIRVASQQQMPLSNLLTLRSEVLEFVISYTSGHNMLWFCWPCSCKALALHNK